jgi:nicotinamide mononucleotide transporter
VSAWWSVESIAFTVIGYPMSWIELVGTLAYLASVVLIARRHMLTWPVGILASALYAAVFWQIRLYSDAIEQAYFVAVSVYGWWTWAVVRADRAQPVPVGWSSSGDLVFWAVSTAALSLAAGAAMTHVHVLLPSVFPAPADFPWLDAATTVASFVAMWLLARRRVESWIYWIAVDVVGIGLYWVKDVKFISLLYVVLLALAVAGFISWQRRPRVGETTANA